MPKYIRKRKVGKRVYVVLLNRRTSENWLDNMEDIQTEVMSRAEFPTGFCLAVGVKPKKIECLPVKQKDSKGRVGKVSVVRNVSNYLYRVCQTKQILYRPVKKNHPLVIVSPC